jgi:hypothetical protein
MTTDLEVSFREHCRQIIERLDSTAKLHPREIEKETAQIQREVARLRDGLIDRLRHAGVTAPGPRKVELDAVNTALSLVVSVEYPVTAVLRAGLEQAARVLAQVSA